MTTGRFFAVCLFLAVSAVSLSGCKEGGTRSGYKDTGAWLIRVGDGTVTVDEFETVFEMRVAAYPYNISQDTGACRELRRRLVNQMIEELILLETAKALKVRVTDKEVEKAAADLTGGVSNETLESMMMENAVSYRIWKQRLKIRLTMEKVIQKALGEQIVLRFEDIEAYKKKPGKTGLIDSDVGGPDGRRSENPNERVVAHLRRKKTEAAYRSWLKQIRQQWPIQVNRAQWERLNGH
jgi:hypothetical protein